jgi:LuxR family maltose regulon positive regulatory protein
VAALRRREPGRLAELQATASRWFLENGDPKRALELAAGARDTTLVEQILLSHGLRLVLAGAGATVASALAFVLGRAPRSPVALAYRVILAVDSGDTAAADEALDVLGRVPDDGLDARVAALRKAAALHRARLAVDLPVAHASDLVEDVGLTHLPEGLDPDIRLLVLADRGALRLFEGDSKGARADLDAAVQAARSAGLPSVELYCKNLVAGTYVGDNDVIGARTAAEKAIALAVARGWDRHPSLAYSYMLAGWTAFQMLQPEEAATWAAIAIDVIDSTVDVEVEGAARIGQAIIAFDEPLQRRASLKRLVRTLTWLDDHGGSRTLAALAAPHELRMCLSLGEWQWAERAVERAEKRLGAGGDVAVLQAHLACARGRPQDAIRLLGPVLTGELPALRTTTLTSARLLRAQVAARWDGSAAATDVLLEAVERAVPSGALRPFVDAGAQVHSLVTGLQGRAGALEAEVDAVDRGIRRVLQWQTSMADPDVPHRVSAGVVPVGGWLTERELVVLRDLPSMMTLGEIARVEGLTVNTVKTHVRSIYAKLGATTRREAIGIARALELL